MKQLSTRSSIERASQYRPPISTLPPAQPGTAEPASSHLHLYDSKLKFLLSTLYLLKGQCQPPPSPRQTQHASANSPPSNTSHPLRHSILCLIATNTVLVMSHIPRTYAFLSTNRHPTRVEHQSTYLRQEKRWPASATGTRKNSTTHNPHNYISIFVWTNTFQL